MSTILIFLLLILLAILVYSIWSLGVSFRYRKTLKDYTFTRGANTTENKDVNLKCEMGKKIKIDKAVQICTDPDSNNFENPDTDPIDKDGKFNKDTTVDLKDDMSDECNGLSSCDYNFKPKKFPGNMNCNGTSQLISTYICEN